MYSELHQNVHKISSSQIIFFSIIPCQNTKAYLHMCVNITCQNSLQLLVEHACTDFLAMFCMNLASFLIFFAPLASS